MPHEEKLKLARRGGKAGTEPLQQLVPLPLSQKNDTARTSDNGSSHRQPGRVELTHRSVCHQVLLFLFPGGILLVRILKNGNCYKSHTVTVRCLNLRIISGPRCDHSHTLH